MLKVTKCAGDKTTMRDKLTQFSFKINILVKCYDGYWIPLRGVENVHWKLDWEYGDNNSECVLYIVTGKAPKNKQKTLK